MSRQLRSHAVLPSRDHPQLRCSQTTRVGRFGRGHDASHETHVNRLAVIQPSYPPGPLPSVYAIPSLAL